MKKILKIHIIVPALIILFIGVLFLGWHLLPKRKLNIAVIDKTVMINQNESLNELEADYRKHVGLFWLLSQARYCKDNGDFYDYKNDYYGPVLFNNQILYKKLDSFQEIPDLIYLSDGFGDQNNDSEEYKGITYEDIAAVSTAYLNGSMVIGEFNLNSSHSDEAVTKEIARLFGVDFTGWSGRFMANLADSAEIPAWAKELHQREYGRPWDYSGEGLLLVSDGGEIIVLQKGVDYDENVLTIQITEAFRHEYGNLKLNFYNWFHLTEAQYGTDVIAEFKFNLNETGTKKLQSIASALTFPAVTGKSGLRAEAYYFSGDFSDYVAEARNYRFIGARTFYNFFSFDRAGDITNFYWKFYTPLMEKLLRKAEDVKPVQAKAQEASARISDGKMQVLENGAWKNLILKGFNINAELPGQARGDYTRDISVYSDYLTKVSEMNGNCVRVYDLLPPEFYRALSEFNLKNEAKIYLIQSVVPPRSVSDGEYTSAAALTALSEWSAKCVDALHGHTSFTQDETQYTYINDVSGYVLAYIAELDLTYITKMNASGYTFAGDYAAGEAGAESVMAYFCDSLYSAQAAYGGIVPVGAKGDAALLGGRWANGVASFDPGKIKMTEKAKGQFFTAFSLRLTDEIFLDNELFYASYLDAVGTFAYGGYLEDVKTLQPVFPVLIDRFGVSTNQNAYEKARSAEGKTEQEQGALLVRMHKEIEKQGFLGGLIADLNDTWLGEDSEADARTIPAENDKLWKNALDPAENTGVYATEPAADDRIGMNMKDSDRMNELSVSCDEAYLYMTILLSYEVDYDSEQLIIGLDTYQRNNGEYFYDAGYFANSLSGMEFVIKFESKNSAALYAIPSYDVSKGTYASTELYTGQYNFLADLKYGTFESSNNGFYQTGSTLHIRLPWSLLNFTDPANRLVINDTRSYEQIVADPFGLQVTSTEGIIFSMLIADKTTKDTLYLFPLTKQSNGYKTFSWSAWEKADYNLRGKEGVSVIAKYFSDGV